MPEVEDALSLSPIMGRLPLFALSRLGRVARQGIRDAFESEGLSWRAHVVLLCLQGRDGLSQRELAELSATDPSDLVKLLDGMERAGQVRRDPDPHDRRRRVLTITQGGVEALHHGEAITDRATDRVLSRLDLADRELLHGLALRALDAEG
ncbi:MarR family winged helix-turn-helix transcriptional regulator [Kitasatospora sp. NPDC094011]|uniref:MarR family winged helix-turn-helix transcriptional regulator n=1 Tax=Kitasatospora sp. NPDC094011 TaxID=3364090 RepID=UPI0038263B8E